MTADECYELEEKFNIGRRREGTISPFFEVAAYSCMKCDSFSKRRWDRCNKCYGT